MEFITAFFGSLFAGLGLGYFVWIKARKYKISRAQIDASEFLQEVKDQIESEEFERQERVQEIEGNAWSKVEPELLKTEENIEALQEAADEKKAKNDLIYSQERQKSTDKEKLIRLDEDKQNLHAEHIQTLKSQLHDLNKQMTVKLCELLNISAEQIKSEIKTSLEETSNASARRLIEFIEHDYREHAESKAKNIIDIALDRFARAYSSERGIGSAHFPDPQTKDAFCDPDGNNIKTLQELTGCDIYIQAESDLVGVAGFDPVRRELTRRTLEKIFKDKRRIDPAFIQKTFEAQKRELFKQIKADGDAIARELRLENMHPEVRQMMGSLRYRYSFTQNQYFHCSEVGWLCGLLASELKLETKVARRSGLLHDIGKSMDHASEGGHAVIGANFIAERGESPDVVHNVRAHHYDEQPSSDIAFLVIAADAISGARPGARRSTLESYNQKVTELQDIARSFAGVNDAYVLSGGRELRVFVNSKKIDDLKALEMSKQIATRVEDECSYPGQIKIVVVRETVVTEGFQSRAHA
jgi:ribonucrease Y